jgi:REP element-mobilizing transposase RayT
MYHSSGVQNFITPPPINQGLTPLATSCRRFAAARAMDYNAPRRGRHIMPQSFTCLHYHVVFSTKDRQPQIDPAWAERLYGYIGGIIHHTGGTLLQAGGVSDHVHLLCSLSQRTALADVMRDIKANASRWIHETFPDHAAFSWQNGYGAFSVSHSAIESVTQYIANQAEHHRKMTFQEEFIALLKRHNIEFDSEYIWR